jgi:hypothetical protein
MRSLSLYLICFLGTMVYSSDVEKPVVCNEYELSLQEPCSSIQFTDNGINYFLAHVFSQPSYVEYILPNDFSHMIQLVSYGVATNQPIEYMRSVIRLFSNRLKGARYVNARAFNIMLEALHPLLEQYFTQKSSCFVNKFHEDIHSKLYYNFLEKFDLFKADPDLFLSQLSSELVGLLYGNGIVAGEVRLEDLQRSLLVFFEVGLNKLLWGHEDQEYTWELVKNTSTLLEKFVDSGLIVDHEDLNDLFTTLIERYVYFLDCAGNRLGSRACSLINQDVDCSSLLLLTMEEQEDYIEPKRDRLKRVLANYIEKDSCSQSVDLSS